MIKLLKRLATLLLCITSLLGIAHPSFAVNLNTVYNDALVSDPAFKAAESEWLANRERLSIAAADLLPQIGFGGSIGRSRVSNNNPLSVRNIIDTGSYSFKVTQTIFDFSKMANVWKAQAKQGVYYASYLAAGQDLFYRVIKTYLDVLLAQDTLHYAKVHKTSSEQLYIRAKYKFKEGLINVTDLEEAKRDYELALASEISAANGLECHLENLATITGVRYERLDGLKDDLELVSPVPEDANAWVEQAKQHNFSLIAANFASQEAKHDIKFRAANHLPVIGAEGTYSYANQTSDNYNGIADIHQNIRQKTLGGALTLNVPIFSGGAATASVNLAKYSYQQAIANLEKTYRETVSTTLQAYLSVISGIKQVEAQKQAVISSQSALRATYISYIVGSRTMSDVSTAQAHLNAVQTDYSKARYSYIVNWAALKTCVGALSEADIDMINSWLSSELKKSAEVEGLENLFGKDSKERLLSGAGQ